MRRLLIVFTVIVVSALALAACGGTDDGGDSQPPDSSTPAAESPAAPIWTTVTTLRSTDAPDDLGLMVSQEFTASGDVQLVLDMPEGAETDGVVVAILPAGEPITVQSASTAETVALPVGAPSQVVSGLDGTYVILVTPSATEAWSVDVQTQQ